MRGMTADNPNVLQVFLNVLNNLHTPTIFLGTLYLSEFCTSYVELVYVVIIIWGEIMYI